MTIYSPPIHTHTHTHAHTNPPHTDFGVDEVSGSLILSFLFSLFILLGFLAYQFSLVFKNEKYVSARSELIKEQKYIGFVNILCGENIMRRFCAFISTFTNCTCMKSKRRLGKFQNFKLHVNVE